MAGNEVQKWADKAMYLAPPIDAATGPKVTLVSCNADPLGEIAHMTMTYEGKFPRLNEITDEQRRFYFDDVFKAKRWAPLEVVNFHFLIEGVTRAFTHQMVRQRTAVYAQESVRFAVKEDVPVGLPASLAGTIPWSAWYEKCWRDLFPVVEESVTGIASADEKRMEMVKKYAEQQASKEQLWRREWDECVGEIGSTYNALVSAGMPAEDARGLLPTNLLTRIHYNTNLRNLYDHAGMRLCTQAQHEWKVVWKLIVEAIAGYPMSVPGGVHYRKPEDNPDDRSPWLTNSAWQFDALSKVFKPICYNTGKCEFMSSADRACVIRDRVNSFASLGIPSYQWGRDHDYGDEYVSAIHDEEWMNNHAAARISQ
jgi:thymidylate synthase ThyX